MVDEKEVGKRIKEHRLRKRISLQELADKSGFTKGYLSKVETSQKAPPVSTLITLANVMDITLSDIFGESENKSPICLVKKEERCNIARDGSVFGYSYETLAHKFHDKHMEPYLLTLPVKPKENAVFQHRGEEILFVLRGKMRFFYGKEEFIVKEGDCIYFDASVPHYGVCQGAKEVKCLMVIYTPH